MSERLYELLPTIYRIRDAEQGYTLRALLAVMEQELDTVEEDIAQLYRNWFIETCEDWLAPYIGDLVGYRFVLEEPLAPGAPASTRDSGNTANDCRSIWRMPFVVSRSFHCWTACSPT